MTTHEKRLRALEMSTRQHSLLSLKKWLHCLTDLELAEVTATVPDLDAEIFILIMVCDDAEIRAVVADMGHLGHEK